MSNKAYGLGKEREAKRLLEKEGWSCQRSRGSFGFYDILAMHPDDGFKFVQIKATKRKYASFGKDIEEIFRHKVPSNVQKEFWIYWSPNKERKNKRGWERIVIGDI